MNEVRIYSVDHYKLRFRSEGCPVCGSRKVRTYKREKSSQEYTVYVCGECKRVIKRRFS